MIKLNLELQPKMGRWKQLSRFIGPVILLLILLKIDRQKLWKAFLDVKLAYLFLGMLASLFIPALRSIRWNLINKSLNIHLSFYESLRIVFMSWPIGLVTPGRIGMDFYRFLTLRAAKFPAAFIAYGLVLDRLCDLIPLGLIFIAGIGYFKNPGQSVIVFLKLFFLLLIVVLYILVRLKKKYLVKSLSYFTSKYFKKVGSHLLNDNENGFRNKFPNFQGGLVIIFSFLIIIICALQVNAFTLSLGENIPFGFLQWCVSAMIISNFLPLSFLGIGTRDVTLIFLLSLVEVKLQKSVSISSFVLAALIFHGVIGCIFHLFPMDKFSLIAKKIE